MLHARSIESVYTLSQKASAAGIAIAPKLATPLALAVSACYGPQMEIGIKPSDSDSFWATNVLEQASTRKEATGYPHDDAIETLSAMGSAAVQRLLKLARNEVRAHVDAVMNDVESIIQESEKVSMAPVAIIANNLTGIWSNTTLLAMIENYSNVPAESVQAPNMFNNRSEDEIVELLKTNTVRMDNAIAEWVEILGKEYISRIYGDYFARGGGNSMLDWALDMSNAVTPEDGRNRALTIYLLAQGLRDKPDAESAIGLTEFTRAMDKAIEQSGRLLYREFEKFNTDQKSNTLLRSWPSVSGSFKDTTLIAVNGEVYARWLRDGGTPEVILGSYVSDRATGYAHLLANAERYTKEWARAITIRRNQMEAARYDAMLSALSVSIAKQIAALKEDDLVVTNHSVLHVRLNDELGKVTALDIQPDTIYATVRHLICHTFYAHTQAEYILRSIDAAMKANPELDAREAALSAVIDMVADWVYALMSINRMAVRSESTDSHTFMTTINTLANAVELACDIVERSAGNDISNQLEGAIVTQRNLADTFAIKFQAKLKAAYTIG